MITWWLRVTRASEWWWYKIPPLLAVGYALILVRGANREAVVPLLLAIVSLSFVAAFAYVVNDATDIVEDARRHKANGMANLAPWQRRALGGLLVLGAFSAAVAAGIARVGLVVLAVECALPLLYSVRPVRFKERGLAGVVTDALLVHTVPALWIGLVLAPYGQGSARAAVVLSSALVWATGLGLRGILTHQLASRERVANAGTSTFAQAISPTRLQHIILRRILPIETMALLVFVVALAPVAPLLIPAVALFLVTERMRHMAQWRIPYFRSESGTEHPYVSLVFNEAHEVWLPVVLVVQLAVRDPVLAGLVAVHIAVFAPSLRQCARGYARLPSELQNQRASRPR